MMSRVDKVASWVREASECGEGEAMRDERDQASASPSRASPTSHAIPPSQPRSAYFISYPSPVPQASLTKARTTSPRDRVIVTPSPDSIQRFRPSSRSFGACTAS